MLLQKLLDVKISIKILGVIVLIVALFVIGNLTVVMPFIADTFMRTQRESLTDVSGPVMSLVKEYDARIKKGEFTPEEGKARAIERIKNFRYGNGDYFWINDVTQPVPRMIMHPTVPSLDGKILDDPKFNCATALRYGDSIQSIKVDNKNLFSSFVEVSLKSGKGFVSYLWPKPKPGGGVTAERFPKESYVMLYEPWGWVIGTGVYIDDVLMDIATIRNYLAYVMLAVMAVAAIAAVLMARSISNPLGKLVTYAGQVADGDFNASIAGIFHGELDTLRGSIASMVASLKEKIGEAQESCHLAEEETLKAQQAKEEADRARHEADLAKREGMLAAAAKIKDVVGVVSGASQELSQQIDLSSQGTAEQSKSVAETATAMEEMTASVIEVAKNAAHAAATSDEAKLKADEGAKVVAKVIDSIRESSAKAVSLKTDMAALGKRAEGIGQIMSVISDIADQTNLLALNAAIEAARAGDAGRGFAVVADEVRKLAEKTMTATKEVAEAISAVQQATSKNMQGVDASVTVIERATELAERSGEALAHIVRLADETHDQIRAIATASEQQSSTTEEINHSIEDINRISMETAQAMQHSAKAVMELAEQAQELGKLVREMEDSGDSTEALPAGRKPRALR